MLSIWIAFAVDFIVGDPVWFPHPVRIMGKYINWFEKQVRKKAKSKKALKGAGALLVVSLVLISYLLTWKIESFFYLKSPVIGRIVEVGFLWTCFALQCLKKECMKIYDSLQERMTEQARKQISFLVSRDTQSLDEKGICKATVETAAENMSDGVIAPLFYMIIGGAPLAVAYKAVNTMDSMVGYHNERYEDFGFFPARFDDIVNFIPARLTGFFMIAWAFLTGKNAKEGYQVMLRDHNKSKSPNAGWPESAAAGILGVALCGPTSYFGVEEKKPIIGENKKEMGPEAIHQVCALMTGTTLLMLVTGTILRVLL